MSTASCSPRSIFRRLSISYNRFAETPTNLDQAAWPRQELTTAPKINLASCRQAGQAECGRDSVVRRGTARKAPSLFASWAFNLRVPQSGSAFLKIAPSAGQQLQSSISIGGGEPKPALRTKTSQMSCRRGWLLDCAHLRLPQNAKVIRGETADVRRDRRQLGQAYPICAIARALTTFSGIGRERLKHVLRDPRKEGRDGVANAWFAGSANALRFATYCLLIRSQPILRQPSSGSCPRGAGAHEFAGRCGHCARLLKLVACA